MRVQLVPDSPEEEAALRQNPTARPLFEPLLPVIQARSLIAGVELGLFDAIGREARGVADLAAARSLDADALELLVRVLVCAGYLTADQDRYRLTELALATLLSDSPMPLAGWVRFNATHWDVIGRLEEVVKSGTGIGLREQLADEADWVTHQEAMLETARPAAQWVAGQVPVREGATAMLDVGGGHGLYGALICRAHPPMRSEVLEQPEAIAAARKLAAREGIDDVVSHSAGDLLADDLGRDAYDLVFLGNIVHHVGAEQTEALFGRIKTALRGGGTIAIWDFKRPAAGAPPDLVADGLALLFRITSATRCYTVEEHRDWLERAGFRDVVVHPTPVPAQIFITGRVT